MIPMKARLALLLVGAAVAVYAAVQYAGRVAPEVLEAGEALRRAKSWRADLEIHSRTGAGLWSTVRVVCPDRMELTLQGARFSHTIQIGDRWWTQDIAAPHWTEVPNNNATPTPCRFGTDQPVLFANPVAKAMAIAAEFDRALRHHLKFARGQMSDVEGQACREWTVDDSYTVCLGEKDRLPLRFTSLDGTVKASFKQWNEEISIDAPQNDL
jgi:hypothetical protein